MNRIILHLFSAALCLPIGILFGGCRHKGLCYGEKEGSGRIEIFFDWSNAPDADPVSMAAFLYSEQGEEFYRYIFSNKTGGQIRVPVDIYDGICLNADLTDWAVETGRDEIDTYEISTTDADALPVSGIPAKMLPRAQTSSEERLANRPGMLWGSRRDKIKIIESDGIQKIIMYPEEEVCHYTVDVYDVKNLDKFHSGGIDATLSGMAEGYLVGGESSSVESVTHPFIVVPDNSRKSLHSEFLTFGETSGDTHSHILTIYIVDVTGKKWNCNIDVTSQVHNAPDPRHVHIVVRGVEFPDPAPAGTVVVPDVEDWETVNITLPM